jgi:predicted RNA binding protein YcfA (HicA-like mRNA interferase family)
LPTLRPTSGRECVKILCNRFGFAIARQRGSHVVLRKETTEGAVGTVVPMHGELKVGTLKGIPKLARVAEDEFAKHQ